MDKSKRDELPPEKKKIWDAEGNAMAFEITRQRVETGLTFSSEAFDNYLESIVTFIGTRVMRYWEETGEPPRVMRTLVNVAIDHAPPDKAQQALDERPEKVALQMLKDLVGIHASVQMDTPEDKALHAKVIQTYEEAVKALEERIP